MPSTSDSQTETSLITPCCLSIATAITPEASWVAIWAPCNVCNCHTCPEKPTHLTDKLLIAVRVFGNWGVERAEWEGGLHRLRSNWPCASTGRVCQKLRHPKSVNRNRRPKKHLPEDSGVSDTSGMSGCMPSTDPEHEG